MNFTFSVIIDVLGTDNHLAHDFCHEGLCLIGSFLHFLVADLYGGVEASQVGNDTDTEGTDATMVSYYHLRDGRHANGIAPHYAIHLIFCRGLEGWSLYAYVNTIGDANLALSGNLCSCFDKVGVVGLMHVGEARTCGEVLATQRMFREQIDMVGDDHQVANLEGWIHATCCIGDKECLDAQLVHDANGEGDSLHAVAFVVVETSLHGQDVNTSQLAEDELAGVAFYGRDREVRYLAIGDFELVSYFGS